MVHPRWCFVARWRVSSALSEVPALLAGFLAFPFLLENRGLYSAPFIKDLYMPCIVASAIMRILITLLWDIPFSLLFDKSILAITLLFLAV